MLSPDGKTQEIWNNNWKDGDPFPFYPKEATWEDWHVFFRAITEKINLNDGLILPPGYTVSMQNDVIPRHTALLNRRYMLAQVPVTQELWESVMGNNPSRFKETQRPVENVSWKDCQDFVTKLNGMKEELGVPQGYEFTLPLESEWELASRAAPTNAFLEKLERYRRTMTHFHTGMTLNDKQANYNNDRHFWTDAKKLSFGGTRDVGTYPANHWGLYDMHGNVWEWCQDACGYGPLYVERQYDDGKPSGEGRLPDILDNFYSQNVSILDGFYRSRRGGSWSSFAENCHSAYRSFGNPMRGHDDTGFRLCLAAMR